MTVRDDSFNFAGVDMLAEYGIRVLSHDLLKPPLRPRKVIIQSRDGAYDFGAMHYDERRLRIRCEALDRHLARAEIRELALLLDQKGRIFLWDEPDKYYIGRVYDAPDLTYIGMAGHRFTLNFLCDPFAYGNTYDGQLPDRIEYPGTARTPTRLSLTNVGSDVIHGLQVRIRERRG